MFAVSINPTHHPDLRISLMFTLSIESYPEDPPPFSVQCTSLSRKECEDLKNSLKEEAEIFRGSPMVLSILTALQDKQIKIAQPTVADSAALNIKDAKMYVLQLDHMRNKARYVKTIQRWCKELAIVGGLIFYLRWIFIILQGDEESIKTYIQRNKTQVVDVDSSGRPCKERLLSVLHVVDHPITLTEFSMCDFKNNADLKEWMTEAELGDLYESIIAPVVLKK
ncbi:RWD domain-containing protein 3-like isoform X2 [Penaeus japonicus]|nr:RWD domain-containing protein 3-like isoform X2 [Penaeus japonicus]XP_042878534.1 RWD domain-containing protein 3-like isoform X2 [Penaeus japonicus]